MIKSPFIYLYLVVFDSFDLLLIEALSTLVLLLPSTFQIRGPLKGKYLLTTIKIFRV